MRSAWYVCMSSIYPRSEVKGLQRFAILKYYNAQEWECIFTLELNAAKDIDYIEKKIECGCVGAHGHWFQCEMSMSCCEC